MTKNIRNIGTRAAIKRGVLMHIMSKIETVPKLIETHCLKNSGIFVSTLSMSFAKRLRIRPIGVDSKKLMPNLSIEPSKRLWSFRAASTYSLMNKKSPQNVSMPFFRQTQDFELCFVELSF